MVVTIYATAMWFSKRVSLKTLVWGYGKATLKGYRVSGCDGAIATLTGY